ncbi:MAG TPA: helix-turn-helix domain-containing protein [Saprospiraceae bacterium]|nr:helix-turn-helix domain-containing protein [Saprospiraceae bacterium]
MKKFEFSKTKYGVELLMDVGFYPDFPNYYFESDIHTAAFFEIILFTQCEGYLELDEQIIKLFPNTIIFISPFQKRKWFVNKAKIQCYFLLFQDDFLSNFFSDKLFTYRLQFFFNKSNPLFLSISDTLKDKLISIYEEINEEIHGIHSDSNHLIRSMLYFVLIKLNREYAKEHRLSIETIENNLAYGLKRWVVREYKKYRQVDYYAQLIGVSRITLNKAVKAQFSITVSEMINRFILTEIKTELLYTNKSIKEISADLHFSEPHHLTRFFKTKTGKTPSEFKNDYHIGR